MKTKKSFLGFLVFSIIMIGIATICFYKFGLQKNDSKDDVKRTKTYEEIKEQIENQEFKIRLDKGSISEIVVLDSKIATYSFYIRDGKLTYVAFSEADNSDVMIAYNMDVYVGASADTTSCRYRIADEMNFGNVDCTEEEIVHIKEAYKSYNNLIKDKFKLSKDELYEFILEHNKRTRDN